MDNKRTAILAADEILLRHGVRKVDENIILYNNWTFE